MIGQVHLGPGYAQPSDEVASFTAFSQAGHAHITGFSAAEWHRRTPWKRRPTASCAPARSRSGPASTSRWPDGQPLNLTARELELLTALMEREGRIVSREELYRTVWGEPYRKSDRSVDVYVGKLRQKLDDALPGRRFIHTHFGFGYRFQASRPRPLTVS